MRIDIITVLPEMLEGLRKRIDIGTSPEEGLGRNTPP